MTNQEAADALLREGMNFCPHLRDSGHCIHVIDTTPKACKCCWCGREYRFIVNGPRIEVHGPHLVA